MLRKYLTVNLVDVYVLEPGKMKSLDLIRGHIFSKLLKLSSGLMNIVLDGRS